MKNTSSHRRIARGFTLIELIAALVIIGVIAAVVAPEFSNLGKSTRDAKIAQMKAALETAASDSSVICVANPACATGRFDVAYIYVPQRGRVCQFVQGFIDSGNNLGGLYCEVQDFVRHDGFDVAFDPGTNFTEFRLKIAPTPTACLARYHDVLFGAPEGTRPRVEAITTGC